MYMCARASAGVRACACVVRVPVATCCCVFALLHFAPSYFSFFLAGDSAEP